MPDTIEIEIEIQQTEPARPTTRVIIRLDKQALEMLREVLERR